MATLELIKGQVTANDGSAVDDLLSGGTEYVALYFSAHWCPPCRNFTPVLAEYYKECHGSDKIEIVFVSSDRDEAGFKGYFAEMPWKALKYDARDVKAKLSEQFGVRGIPTLIVLDKSGNIVDKEARNKVAAWSKGSNINWGK